MSKTELMTLSERTLISDALQRAAAECRAAAAEKHEREVPPTMLHLHRKQVEALEVRAQKQEQLAARMREAQTISIITVKYRSKQ